MELNCHLGPFETICPMMYKAFEIAGYPSSFVEKFPAMISAFRFGAPPAALPPALIAW